MNHEALKVTNRVYAKLKGTDFEESNGMEVSVADQVDRLIVSATKVENLASMYIGWAAFW